MRLRSREASKITARDHVMQPYCFIPVEKYRRCFKRVALLERGPRLVKGAPEAQSANAQTFGVSSWMGLHRLLGPKMTRMGPGHEPVQLKQKVLLSGVYTGRSVEPAEATLLQKYFGGVVVGMMMRFVPKL